MINREFLRQRRNELRLTCSEVAVALGYESRNGYWRIEAGLTKLTADQLLLLAQLYEADLSAFYVQGGEPR